MPEVQRSLFPDIAVRDGHHSSRAAHATHERPAAAFDPRQMHLLPPEGDDLEACKVEIKEALADVIIFRPETYPSPSDQTHDEEILLRLKQAAIIHRHMPVLIKELRESLYHSIGLEEDRIATAISHLQQKRTEARLHYEKEPAQVGSILVLRTREPANLALGIDPRSTIEPFTNEDLKRDYINPLLLSREKQFRQANAASINFEGSYNNTNRYNIGNLHALQFVENLDANLDYFLRKKPDLLYHYLLVARKALHKIHDRYQEDLARQDQGTTTTVAQSSPTKKTRLKKRRWAPGTVDGKQASSGERN